MKPIDLVQANEDAFKAFETLSSFRGGDAINALIDYLNASLAITQASLELAKGEDIADLQCRALFIRRLRDSLLAKDSDPICIL